MKRQTVVKRIIGSVFSIIVLICSSFTFAISQEDLSGLSDEYLVKLDKDGKAIGLNNEGKRVYRSKGSSFAYEKIVKYDEDGNITGFTEEGKRRFNEAREAFKKRKKLLAKKYKQYESITHVAHLARMSKQHAFFYGPPGGGKTSFVKSMLNYDLCPSFVTMLGALDGEDRLLGAQNISALNEGRYELNTDDRIAQFELVLIDEIGKASPILLPVLLPVLEAREVLLGHKVLKIPLETAFSTSNKYLYEFYRGFEKNGDGSTADAILSRFLYIVFVHNWLDKKDQAEMDNDYLDERRKRRLRKKRIIEEIHEIDLYLDWDFLRDLSNIIFIPSDEFMNIARNFIDNVRDSVIYFGDNYKDISSISGHTFSGNIKYYPTVGFDERWRQKVRDTALMSLFLDFMTSPLVEDVESLEKMLKNTPDFGFSVTPISLWRLAYVLTTTTNGETGLVVKDDGGVSDDVINMLSVDFGSFLDDKGEGGSFKSQNKKVRDMAEFIRQERRIFVENLENSWKTYYEAEGKSKDLSEPFIASSLGQCIDMGDNSCSYIDIEKALLIKKYPSLKEIANKAKASVDTEEDGDAEDIESDL